MKRAKGALAALAVTIPILSACASADPTVTAPATTATVAPTAEGVITLYSGRTEELVAPLIARFEAASGVDVEVRYGSSPEMAATLLTEAANSPADLFYAQDPASLGSVA